MAGGSSWNGVKGMKKLFCVLLVGVVMVSLLCAPAFAVAINEDYYTYWCPNCARFIDKDEVNTNGFLIACPYCNCALSPREGSIFRGGGAGRIESPKRYYTNGASPGTVNGGSTQYYPVMNKGNNTLNFTSYNTLTSNYVYNSYTYNNYTYNNEYNYYTYNINNQNYYVTNNYTYVTISYPSGEDGQYENVNLYYELPDGRNSFDLKAEDVWGEYFLYNFENYDLVVEDDKTQWLCHFDGNLDDASAYKRVARYLEGASYVFDESAGFGQALVWPASAATHRISFPLNKFGTNEDFTIECRFYLTPNTLSNTGFGVSELISTTNRDLVSLMRVRGSSSLHLVIRYRDVAETPDDYISCPVPFGQWFTVALVRHSGVFYVYLNGLQVKSFPCALDFDTQEIELVRYPDNYFNSTLLVDEFRISSGALYTDSYVPSSQPFDTNKVLVLPESASENDVFVKSNIPITEYRVGGVRPTYPQEGSVYVYLEDGVVSDVQQYQTNGWYSVDASIYTSSGWQDFKKYDLSGYGNEGDLPGSDGEEGGEGEGGEGSDNPEDSSFWDKVFGTLGGALSTIFKAVATLFVSLVEGVATLVTSILGVFTDFSGLAAGFSSFLSEVFPFLPPEITSLLVLAISLSIAMAVIRFLKG